MKFLKDVTRGGQIGYHFLNMFRQVNERFKWPALILTLCIGGYFISTMPKVYYMDASNYYQAFLLDKLPKLNKNKQKMKYLTQYRVETRCVEDVLRSWSVRNNTDKFWEYLITTGYFCLGGIIALYVLVMVFFHYIGDNKTQPKVNKGEEFMEAKKLAKQIKSERKDSFLKLGELPLIKNSETNHILLTGTTGSGKSNCIKSLIQQVRTKKQKMIIVDTTGEYVNFFYDAKRGDKILSPFDSRSEIWSMWDEYSSTFDIDNFVATLFPKDTSADKFWSVAPRVLFKAVFKKIKTLKEPTYKELFHNLSIENSKVLKELVVNTAASPYFEKDNEKTMLSIRSTMIPSIQFLEHLQEVKEDGFTIKNWIQNENENGILFLLCTPKQRETVSALFTVWMEAAVSNIMELGVSSERRVWFVIDELASLKKLPALPTLLSEVRKFGGCGIIGTQSIHQITEIYGVNVSKSILDLLNTKIFFRCTEPYTQNWITRSLGEQEEEKVIENYSYGAHQMRDGVSLTKQTHVKPIILGSELKKLKTFEAFVQLPEGYPITKVIMPLTKENNK